MCRVAIETNYDIFIFYVVVFQIYKNVCIRLPWRNCFVYNYAKCFQSRRSFTVTVMYTKHFVVHSFNQKGRKEAPRRRPVSRKGKISGTYEHSTAITSTENLFKLKMKILYWSNEYWLLGIAIFSFFPVFYAITIIISVPAHSVVIFILYKLLHKLIS